LLVADGGVQGANCVHARLFRLAENLLGDLGADVVEAEFVEKIGHL
jgi:hypothetical protein